MLRTLTNICPRNHWINAQSICLKHPRWLDIWRGVSYNLIYTNSFSQKINFRFLDILDQVNGFFLTLANFSLDDLFSVLSLALRVSVFRQQSDILSLLLNSKQGLSYGIQLFLPFNGFRLSLVLPIWYCPVLFIFEI